MAARAKVPSGAIAGQVAFEVAFANKANATQMLQNVPGLIH